MGCGGKRRVKVDASWEDGIAISRDWTAKGGAVWGHEKFEMPCGEVKYAVGYGSLDSEEGSKMERKASSSRWFL